MNTSKKFKLFFGRCFSEVQDYNSCTSHKMKEKEMKYKFKVYEDGKEVEDKEAMSFKKLLKSLVIPNPKWTGWIAYKNKKDKYVKHSILNGKRV